jgi:hypothetical protein
MEQLSNLHQQNQMSIYQLMKWWENKSAPEHIKSGHFDVQLYIRVCKAKENFTPNIDSPKKV